MNLPRGVRLIVACIFVHGYFYNIHLHTPTHRMGWISQISVRNFVKECDERKQKTETPLNVSDTPRNYKCLEIGLLVRSCGSRYGGYSLELPYFKGVRDCGIYRENLE